MLEEVSQVVSRGNFVFFNELLFTPGCIGSK